MDPVKAKIAQILKEDSETDLIKKQLAQKYPMSIGAVPLKKYAQHLLTLQPRYTKEEAFFYAKMAMALKKNNYEFYKDFLAAGPVDFSVESTIEGFFHPVHLYFLWPVNIARLDLEYTSLLEIFTKTMAGHGIELDTGSDPLPYDANEYH